MQTPRRLTPKKPKRDHVPPLSPEKLMQALEQLQALPVSTEAKQQLASIMRAASTPNAESPEAVTAQLPEERQAVIAETTKVIIKQSKAVTARGKEQLLGMSAAEWDRLVTEAVE